MSFGVSTKDLGGPLVDLGMSPDEDLLPGPGVGPAPESTRRNGVHNSVLTSVGRRLSRKSAEVFKSLRLSRSFVYVRWLWWWLFDRRPLSSTEASDSISLTTMRN